MDKSLRQEREKIQFTSFEALIITTSLFKKKGEKNVCTKVIRDSETDSLNDDNLNEDNLIKILQLEI